MSRRKPSLPKPNVAVSLEQLESRNFPNDLFSLLGSALVSGGLSILGHAGASPRPRDPRDSDGMALFVSTASRTAVAAPPAILSVPAPPPANEQRPSNDGQTLATVSPAVAQGTAAEDALTAGLGDPLHYETPIGGATPHGIHLPDSAPTGNGSFGVAARTSSDPPAAAAGPIAPAPSGDYGNPAATLPGSSLVGPAGPSTPSPVSSSMPGSHGPAMSGGVDPDGCGTMGGNGCGGGGTCTIPRITAISPDTGYSSSDQITNSQNLVLYGTADPNMYLTLFLANQQVENTTSDANGNWSYDYSWNTLPQGTYEFTVEDRCVGGDANKPWLWSSTL
jgi:hypothetical protein